MCNVSLMIVHSVVHMLLPRLNVIVFFSVFDTRDESTRIGVLGVSVQCLAALRVIERQLRTETMST